MKCVTCNTNQAPIHSARPNKHSVDNYHICPACGHEELVHVYELVGGN